MAEYEWDPAKRAANIAKHGLDFLEGMAVLEGPHVLRASPRDDETRWIATGRTTGYS